MKVLQIVTKPVQSENHCDEKEVMKNLDNNIPQATTDKETTNTGLRELYKQKYDTDEEISQTDPEDDPKFQVKQEVINCGNQVVQQESFERNEDKHVSLRLKK